jgi:hypothetical protein
LFLPQYANRTTAGKVIQRQFSALLDKAGLEVDPNIADLPSLPANLLLLHAWGFAQTAAFNHPSWPFWRL